MVVEGVDQNGLSSSEWSPYNMRQYNISVLKPPESKSPGANSNSKSSMSSYTSAAKSLDLLRQNLQRSINQDIKVVITKYFDEYFKRGIENIKTNLGPESVTDDHIQNMCRQILEEAKKMYPVDASASPSSCNSNSAIDPSDLDYHNSQNNSSNSGHDIKPSIASPMFGIKRESDTDSEVRPPPNPPKKAKKSNSNKNKSSGSVTSNNSSANSTASNTNDSSPSKPKKPSGPSRKHVAQWDANKMTTDTLFIMGAKANKALGFAQTRGRLYVKHPGLFKYASDADDKEWLSKNKLMPATGGRAYIMLLEDIEKLARDNKLKHAINFDDIKGFQVPDFILDKMKSYINTWKKQYAEETQKPPPRKKNNSKANNGTASNAASTSAPPSTTTTTTTSVNIAPPQAPLPPMPMHNQVPTTPTSTMQHSNALGPPQMNNFHIGVNHQGNVLYDSSMMPMGGLQPTDDLSEFLQLDKPPPVYPGDANHQQAQQIQHQLQHQQLQQQQMQHQQHQLQQQLQQQQQLQLQQQQMQQQQHSLPPPQMQNHSGSYMHTNHMDPIEQALRKGDWSSVSDGSLLQFALQSSRSMGDWDYDIMDPNGALGGAGNLGDNSSLLQISPDGGAHLGAPPMGSVSPSCELTAVLDSAFPYADT